jgi:hypothetical protein
MIFFKQWRLKRQISQLQDQVDEILSHGPNYQQSDEADLLFYLDYMMVLAFDLKPKSESESLIEATSRLRITVKLLFNPASIDAAYQAGFASGRQT